MAPGQINLKEMSPEQMGFGQLNQSKMNALKNEFLLTIFKIAQPHFVSR